MSLVDTLPQSNSNYRRDAYSLEKADGVKALVALAAQAAESGGRLRLVWLDVKPSLKHSEQNKRFDTGHIISNTLDTFYDTPRGKCARIH
jgi:hypothetical protein